MRTIYNTLLFLPCFVSAFWSITLLATWKDNLRAQNIWGICMLFMTACTLVWGILFNEIYDYSLYYKLDLLDVVFTLTFFPFIYYFFRSLTNPDRFTWKQYIWLAPALAIGVISTVLYACMGEEQSTRYIRQMVEEGVNSYLEPGTLMWWHRLISDYGFALIMLLQLIAVMIYSTVNLVRYRKGLTHIFSNLDEKSIENVRAVLIAVYVILIVGLGVECMWSWSQEHYFFLKHVLMVSTGLLFYYMSFHVSKLRFAAESLLSEEEESQTNEVVPEVSGEFTNQPDLLSTSEKFLPELTRLIDEEQIFLQPNLSVNDLARLLQSNRTYISQIINTEFGSSFYDHINERRIRFALKLMKENPALIQEQISQASGFTHVATFSRVFKRHTGKTFREWQRSAN